MFKWLASIFEAKKPAKKQASNEKEIGKIIHYFGHVSAGVIRLSNTLKIGDKIHVKGHTSDFMQNVTSMQVEHKEISEARAGDEVGIKVSGKVHPGDVIYKVIA